MDSTVLVVEDDQPLREALCDTLELGGYKALSAASGQLAIDAVNNDHIDLVVSDVQMGGMDGYSLLKRLKANNPEVPVLLMTAYGTIQNAVQAMRDGATDYLVKPFESEVLVAKVSQLLPQTGVTEKGIVAVDPTTLETLNLSARVASTDATVMITGESGTGKEILFRYIHAHSPRVNEPCVAINCAAIPENMLEAILFGYEKGAFTGAYRACPGKFEQANGGSLLLDEISEMSLPLQAKLLRVLQEREVERLGGQNVTKLDVRVIATSNRNLREEVAASRFREDLYYRLNVFPIHMAALRDRRDDIVPLAEFFLARDTRAQSKQTLTIAPEAEALLRDYAWPGNVRELDNVMQRARIVVDGAVVTAAHLHFENAITPNSNDQPMAPDGAEPGNPECLGDELKSQERRLIVDALEEGNGSRKRAAEKLGLSPRTLRYKIAKLREQGFEIP